MAKANKSSSKETNVSNETNDQANSGADAVAEQTALNPPTVGAVASSASSEVGAADNTTQAAVEAEQAQLAAQAQWAAFQGTASHFSEQLQEVLAQITDSNAINGFKEISVYLTEMAPGKNLDPLELSRRQVGLYRTLESMLQTDTNEFHLIFGSLLRVFLEHKDGALGGTYAFRGMAWVTLNAEERESFMAILNMLGVLADPKTRAQNKRTIDLSRTLGKLRESALRNVSAFLNT